MLTLARLRRNRLRLRRQRGSEYGEPGSDGDKRRGNRKGIVSGLQRTNCECWVPKRVRVGDEGQKAEWRMRTDAIMTTCDITCSNAPCHVCGEMHLRCKALPEATL